MSSSSDYYINSSGQLSQQDDTSYTPSTNWSLYTFIGITFVFFYLKYNSDVSLYDKLNGDGLSSLIAFKNSLFYFLMYFITIFILQVTASSIDLNKSCSNNGANNFMTAVGYCFGPWIFIFLVMVIILVKFPFVKKAFSDVIGYMAVSRKINDIFSKALYSSQDLKDRLRDIGDKEQEKIALADEAIMNIVQNKSVFVNQINLQNFNKFWSSLEPLMKSNAEELKKNLFNEVLRKDNWGELFWYLYTGIFVCFVVSYNVSVKGCKKTTEQLEKDFSTDVPLPNSGGPDHVYIPV